MSNGEQSAQEKTQLPVNIRLMNDGEENTLQQLQEKSIRQLNAQDYTSEQIEAIIDRKRKNRLDSRNRHVVTFVAEHESNIVGFATFNEYINAINALFVDPDYVCQGVGKQLVLAVEEEALKRKIGDLFVISSITAVNFYQSLGYTTVYDIPLKDYEIEIPATLMIKQIAQFTILEMSCSFWDRFF